MPAAVDLSGGAPPPMGARGGLPPTAGQPQGQGQAAFAAFGGQVAQAALNDPVIQQQLKEAAYTHAQQGYQVAREGAAQAVSELRKYIQEGPAGISILCFLGGMATTLVGVLGLLSLTDSISSPFHYVLNAYLTAFGLVTFLLEADVESVRSLRILGKLAPFVERYQIEVFNRANFLTELRGRGLFYIFIGTLAITQCLLCLHFLVGAWNLLMGVFCMLMSFGINPADHMHLGSPQHQQLPLHDTSAPLFAAHHGP